MTQADHQLEVGGAKVWEGVERRPAPQALADFFCSRAKIQAHAEASASDALKQPGLEIQVPGRSAAFKAKREPSNDDPQLGADLSAPLVSGANKFRRGDVLFGQREIMAVLGLSRAQTMLLIERAAFPTTLLADRRCALRVDVENWISGQKTLVDWADYGRSSIEKGNYGMTYPVTRRPRAVTGPVFASAQDPASVRDAISNLDTAFRDFKANHTNKVQAALDEINMRISAGPATGIEGNNQTLTSPDPGYSNLFASWFRKGDQESDLKAANATGDRQAIQAAMQSGSDSAGGYLAPVEWDRRVNRALNPVSPMRRLARIIPTTVRAYSTLYSKDGWGSGWVGETAARPATANPVLDPLVFPHGEIYANPGITQNLLDDADFNLEAWLSEEVAEEFGKQEAIAFLAGNGTNKPRGLLTYIDGGASDDHHPGGNLTVVFSGAAAALPTADGLIDFVYGLLSPYRQNACWLMNSMTAAAIAKLKDGDGNYLWRETYVAGQPATLLGYPVEIDENMPDVAAGALPIAFGDFKRGYVINDRQGVRVLRDPFTAKPYVHFYTTKRVGGGVDDVRAIRLLKIGAAG